MKVNIVAVIITLHGGIVIRPRVYNSVENLTVRTPCDPSLPIPITWAEIFL